LQKLNWIILAICAGLVLAMPGLGELVFARLEQALKRIARNKKLALAAIGGVTILARLALLPWMPVPQPKVHDEFSYLLAADTFAHGRLSNPPHPLWIFFDTFHVIQHPTYASMYPPAQGMVLALGKILGTPWIGVLVSVAAMCMAITWMLQGWMPPEWALLGGVLVLSQVGLFSYWMNSYWGGALAAIGAAMALGALPRIWDRQRTRDAVIFGLGAGILATSRPVEGAIFFIPLGAALVWWVVRKKSGERSACAKRLLLPLASILLCVAGFIACYNWRVTGSPLVFPHFIEGRLIRTAIFLWQHDKPPIAYANPQFEDFYHNVLPGLYQCSWPAAEGQLQWKLTDLWQFFLGPALTIPFLALPWVLKESRNRLLALQAALSVFGLWIIVYYHAHYAAPLMATLVVLMMQSMRVLRGFRLRGHAVGTALTRIIVLFCLFIGPVHFAGMVDGEPNFLLDWLHRHFLLPMMATVVALVILRLGLWLAPQLRARRSWLAAWCEFLLLAGILLQICVKQRDSYPDDYAFVDDLSEPFRKPVEQQLARLPGEHLVVVRYSKDHNSGEEYVYNEADIDHAKTVWAREIPGMDLSPLFNYFRNRDVWIYEPDEDDSAVRPYSAQTDGFFK
jgi:hypothetical protein